MKNVWTMLLGLALTNAVVATHAGANGFSTSSSAILNLHHITFQSPNSFQNRTSAFVNRTSPFQNSALDFQSRNIRTTDFGAESSRFSAEVQQLRAANQGRDIRFTDQSEDFAHESGIQNSRFANIRMKFENPRLQFLNFNAP